MNDNDTDNPRAKHLSDDLQNVYQQMDHINSALQQIELKIEQEYKKVETIINPKKDQDVSKEIQYYFSDFLKNYASDFKKIRRHFD